MKRVSGKACLYLVQGYPASSQQASCGLQGVSIWPPGFYLATVSPIALLLIQQWLRGSPSLPQLSSPDPTLRCRAVQAKVLEEPTVQCNEVAEVGAACMVQCAGRG